MIEKGYVATVGGQMHFRRVSGGGTPVVLLHRTPVTSECFERMLLRLQGKRTALAFDTPGFGQSFRPLGFPGTAHYAGWFLAAIDALGIGEFHVCAHHTGTHFAAEIALLAPGRMRSLLLNGVLYADAQERAALRKAIGDARPVDETGSYLMATWAVLCSLYKRFDPDIIHSELLGALSAIEGRNQAFSAICAQDFAKVLSQVQCPVAIVQSIDDPLSHMLERVRAALPHIPITTLGPAETAAPELQSRQYTEALLRFVEELPC